MRRKDTIKRVSGEIFVGNKASFIDHLKISGLAKHSPQKMMKEISRSSKSSLKSGYGKVSESWLDNSLVLKCQIMSKETEAHIIAE